MYLNDDEVSIILWELGCDTEDFRNKMECFYLSDGKNSDIWVWSCDP